MTDAGAPHKLLLLVWDICGVTHFPTQAYNGLEWGTSGTPTTFSALCREQLRLPGTLPLDLLDGGPQPASERFLQLGQIVLSLHGAHRFSIGPNRDGVAGDILVSRVNGNEVN